MVQNYDGRALSQLVIASHAYKIYSIRKSQQKLQGMFTKGFISV